MTAKTSRPLAAVVVLFLSFFGWGDAARGESCLEHIGAAETQLGIPKGLVLSISLVESALNGAPYPYAMNVRGRTIYDRSARAAARHLRDRAGRLNRHIFVGCMQLSLTYHHQAFQPVERIIAPHDNVWYGAQYLRRLHGRVGSWTRALQRYQGGTRRQQSAYVCKVWNYLVRLNPDSARLLDAGHCRRTEVVIAAALRGQAGVTQVAANPE